MDELTKITDNGVTGNYTFKESEYFYRGHFKRNYPVTPGVILTEVMAQIGVVCLGIYLLREKFSDIKKPQIALTSNNIDFLPVKPKQRVNVVSEKIYFRFNKLKCKVQLFNEKNQLVCKGYISGMLKINDKK